VFIDNVLTFTFGDKYNHFIDVVNTLRQTKGQAVWQTRFHDHVIRDYEECRRIAAYIDMNIANWNEDRYYVQ